MNEETFNNSVRKLLKKVGITSQQEIEKAVQQALDAGELKGDETLAVQVNIQIESVGLNHTIEETVSLE